MSGNVQDRKRLISITEANLKKKNRHIYISGHHDFFPKESYGPPDSSSGTGTLLTLLVEGFKEAVKTDIGTEGRNGKIKPRNFFRNRKWVRKFFEKHTIREGDVIAIERIDKFTYRVTPFESKNVREDSAIPEYWPEVNQDKPTAIDLFAGCGGLSIGLTKAGFQNLIAVEWDVSYCVTFKKNIGPRILLNNNGIMNYYELNFLRVAA